MRISAFALATGMGLSMGLPAALQAAPPADPAAAFGARETVSHMTLSPDGLNVAYIMPTTGQGSVLIVRGLTGDSKPKIAARVAGNPDRLGKCNWVSNERLVCEVYGVHKNSTFLEILQITRLLALNSDGSNVRMLSPRNNSHSHGIALGGGELIDLLPEENGAVLMGRAYIPDDHAGTKLGSSKEGYGVDWVDTRDLSVKHVENPQPNADDFISDGRGNVRIMGLATHTQVDQSSGQTVYSYRQQGSRDWQPLGKFNWVDYSGFLPRAVDPDLNVAYGFKKLDGRLALYTTALDGSLREQLVLARPDVDVDGLITIGRRQRAVGASYATDMRYSEYFDPTIDKLMKSLSKALPGQRRVRVVDASLDENVLLVFAGADNDPGVYYLFDRKQKKLDTFLVARSELEGASLAQVTPVNYPGPDGVMIPGYLTLPPGKTDAKGLPAIVLPHGGPNARDEWGFDWLSQFYAARGFAVLQPNFRGSGGYGDAWFRREGFKAWQVAIGDVIAGGKYLVQQGADPAKLAIVGWSYGGYAALQSAVVDGSLFKAVVAIAPVTDLNALKEEHRQWSDFKLVNDLIGDGPHVREGSPAQQANKIKVPVLLFHGTLDRNVGIAQSQRMADALKSTGGKYELVTWEGLDHYLEDSAARTEMLRKSDAFLRQALGL
jgi:dipeptidyl aminopeptidase/acylaminoacyl peptidase